MESKTKIFRFVLGALLKEFEKFILKIKDRFLEAEIQKIAFLGAAHILH